MTAKRKPITSAKLSGQAGNYALISGSIGAKEVQTMLPALVPKLDTLGPRKIKATSLRPGDWLAHVGTTRPRFVILQNWASLSRVEVSIVGYCASVYDYDALIGMTYLGQGERRKWHRYLPAWFKARVCEYSKPCAR